MKLTELERWVLNQMRACENAGSHLKWVYMGADDVKAARRLVKKGLAREFKDAFNAPGWLPVKQENNT